MVRESGSLQSKINYRILHTLSNAVIPHADHVITKADYQRDFVQKTYDTTCGFTTVPTGVDFDMFDPATVDGENPFPQLFPDADIDWENTIPLLFIGKFITRKGFDRYVDFAESLDDELDDDVVFTAVGGYRDDAFRDRLTSRIQALDDRFLVYPERIGFDQVPGLLAHAGAVVLLSEPENEGVPRTLQEAYAIQTPVIASNVTGIAQAFDDLSDCYLVDRDDPHTFKRAVERAKSETAKMDRNTGRKLFDISSNYAKYADAYNSLSE